MDQVNTAIQKSLEALRLKSPEPTLVPPEPGQIQELREKYEKYTQEHVFHFWGDLKPEEQAKLYEQLSSIDPARVQSIAETVFGDKHDDAQGEFHLHHKKQLPQPLMPPRTN